MKSQSSQTLAERKKHRSRTQKIWVPVMASQLTHCMISGKLHTLRSLSCRTGITIPTSQVIEKLSVKLGEVPGRPVSPYMAAVGNRIIHGGLANESSLSSVRVELGIYHVLTHVPFLY